MGVFDDADALQAAIDELLSSGFNQADASLLASEHAVDEKLGHAYQKAEELEDDLTVPRTAYVSTEARGDAEGGLIGGLVYVGAMAAVGAVVATGGALATAIGAAAVAGGTGGLIASVLAQWISKHHAHYLQEQIDHGGLLLWLRTRDLDHEQRAVDILKRHSGRRCPRSRISGDQRDLNPTAALIRAARPTRRVRGPRHRSARAGGGARRRGFRAASTRLA